ncbi:MAG: hypothetical protein K2O14_09245 [Oscillospiraceae bacterium]|nr:hypothetical protein [Oscillospiraceae bacterium]
MNKVTLYAGSGKSTLAKSLQEYIKGGIKEEYEIISIDDLFNMTVAEEGGYAILSR